MNTYEHKIDADRSLTFETSTSAFIPTGTSAVLIEAVGRSGLVYRNALDLGCGVGIVGIVLAHAGVLRPPVHASDLSAEAVELAKGNYSAHGIDAVVRRGSLFEPWAGEKYDLVIDDISGVAEPVARLSPWFENVPCDSGRDGTRLVCEVIEQAPRYLNPGGRLVFPVLSLSNRKKILDTAGKTFRHVELLVRKEWPLPKAMAPYSKELRELAAEGLIEVAEKFGMLLWSTEVYVASDDAVELRGVKA